MGKLHPGNISHRRRIRGINLQNHSNTFFKKELTFPNKAKKV